MKIEKINQELFERDAELEASFGIEDLKLYGYIIDNDDLVIIGEIVGEMINEAVSFSCTIYDNEGDIIDVYTNTDYGDALVSSTIPVAAYFNGFPISFREYIDDYKIISKIRIIPE